MRRIAAIMAATLLLWGVGLAGPAPKGLEAAITFAGNDDPVDIRIAQRGKDGFTAPATFVQFASSDSTIVIVMDDEEYLAPGEWDLGDYDLEVNKRLRYTPGNPPLMLEGPITNIRVYGPTPGGTVTVNLWCEY